MPRARPRFPGNSSNLTSLPAHIVALAGDPGGANALAPVLDCLAQDRRVALASYAYRQATTLWTGRAFPPPQSAALDEMAIRAVLHGCRLVLCGTSVNAEMAELQHIRVARELGVPSLAVLDYWANYALRFQCGAKASLCLPDSIAVMDEAARREMLAEGFPGERLVVTGQPALDRFAGRASAGERQAARRGVGGGEDLLVVFASQPLAELYGEVRGDPLWLGYHQYSVLKDLLEALEDIAARRGCPITLAVLAHPRESRNAFAGFSGKRVRLRVGEGNPHEWARGADLVCGMHSMFLLESCHAGNLTLSLQPGLRHTDTLPVSRQGVCPVVLRGEEMGMTLESLLFDATLRSTWLSRLDALSNDGKAAQRVAEVALKMSGVVE